MRRMRTQVNTKYRLLETGHRPCMITAAVVVSATYHAVNPKTSPIDRRNNMIINRVVVTASILGVKLLLLIAARRPSTLVPLAVTVFP